MDTWKQETEIPRDYQKDTVVEEYIRPGDNKIENQKVGIEHQGPVPRKAQIKFARNFGASSKNFGDIETLKGPQEQISRENVQTVHG